MDQVEEEKDDKKDEKKEAVVVPFSQIKKFISSDIADSDYFGISVSISGNYAVVGADKEDGSGTDRGAVYLYYKDQGGSNKWGEVKKITASDAYDGDNFGRSVSIGGDYIVVGANNNNSVGRGAVYLYNKDEGGSDNWGEVKKITASDPGNYDYFGNSVSISGDYIAVGAYWKNEGGSDRGAVYIFYKDQGGSDNWGEVKKITASDAADLDFFGCSVSISGNYIVVGAWGEDGSGTNRGAVYIFYKDQGGSDNWGEVKKITASDTADSDFFGCSVLISGNYIAVGAQSEDGSGTDRGAVYLYYKDQGGSDNWGEVKKIIASDAANGDLFGCSVSISGNYIAVGARCKSGSQGASYIFYKDQGGSDNWGEVKKITASDAANSDEFGCYISMSGDYIIVGASKEDGSGTDRGAGYLFKK